MFDPFDLHFFGAPLELSREAIYTMGFFGFWALGIASSALTVFLERSPWEVEPLPARRAGPAGRLPEADDARPAARERGACVGRARAAAQPCWPTSCFSAAGSSSLTARPCTWISPSSWKRENSRLTVSSLRPR